MLALLVAACHPLPPQTAAGGIRIDTLWYATARQRASNRLSYALADSLEFGFYRVASRTHIDAMRADLGIRVIDSSRVSRTAFFAAVSAPSSDSADLVVVSVHGYATKHGKSIMDAAEALVRSGTRARWVAFSWPSTGRGIKWPEHGRLIAGAYRDDSIAAVQSRPAFARLVSLLRNAVGGNRMAITSHSLGAQIVAETLTADSLVRRQLVSDPLRAVGFFEPDISAKRFAEHTVSLLRDVSRRVALYASANDNVLRLSRVLNGGERAGLVQSPALLASGLETVDVTDGISSESLFDRWFGTHHGMRRESSALHDFFDVVVAGQSPSCRLQRGTAQLLADSTWKLLPERSNNTRCY